MKDFCFGEEKKCDEWTDRGAVKTSDHMLSPDQAALDESFESVMSDKTSCSQCTVVLPSMSVEFNAADIRWIEPRRSRPRRVLAGALRTIFLDVPLIVILALYATTMWLQHVHERYLFPQMLDAVWSEDRAAAEVTYYRRECGIADLTTSDGAELFLLANATPKDAYEHQLLHGFTVFPSVLRAETAANLRTHVVSRNYQLRAAESIFVIENENRYSFGLGTEEPTVVAALHEIATHPLLRPSLERIIGPTPALIEMTAITSSYGAKPQYWHDDVIASASAMNYAQSFGPSYTVFIQLQNTTKEMGATAACPGTHYCSDGDLARACEAAGFNLVSKDGYWHAGDALLMNMNSYHRGDGHVDPDAGDRVMFVLTFAPQPRRRAESRLLSQGITFSLRWDLWGHTLNDLEHADVTTRWPWAPLRALGLYKHMNAHTWGIDYVSGTLMRIANDDSGYRIEDLVKFIDRDGGLWWLPAFLQPGHVNFETGESWHDYFCNAFENIQTFSALASKTALAAYVATFMLISILGRNKESSAGRYMLRACTRLGAICVLIYLTFALSRYVVDQSYWAQDIVTKRRYTSPFTIVGTTANHTTTLPTRHDVLIEHRYGSRWLALYNDFIRGHPGNRLFRERLSHFNPDYLSWSNPLQKKAADYLLRYLGINGGRLLEQNENGRWHRLGDAEAANYVRAELIFHSQSVLQALQQELRFLLSDELYGIQSKTALARHHALPRVRALQGKLLDTADRNAATTPGQHVVTNNSTTKSKGLAMTVRHTINLPVSRLANKFQRAGSRLFESSAVTEPSPGAWIESGDIVEVVPDDEPSHWYVGEVADIDAHGNFHILYPGNEDGYVDRYVIRRFATYEEGEEVQCQLPDHEKQLLFQPCIVLRQSASKQDRFDVLHGPHNQLLPNFSVRYMRRALIEDIVRPPFESLGY